MSDPRSEAQDDPRSAQQESGTRAWGDPVTPDEAARKRSAKVERRSAPVDRQTR